MSKNRHTYIWFLFLFVVLCTIPLTGCWDKVEMDDRAFVIGMGVDKFEYEKYIEENKEEEETENIKNDRFRVTYTMPNLGMIAGKAGNEEPKFVKTSTDTTLFSTSAIMDARLNKEVYFGHTKIIVFGEDLVKDPHLFRQALDAMERDPQISRRVPLLVAQGQASHVLNTTPDVEPLMGIYIMKVLETAERTVARVIRKDLGEFLEELRVGGRGLLPRITTGKKDVKVGGAAVFKDYTMQGWLGEKEVRSVLFIQGNVKKTQVPVQYEDMYIPYTVTEVKSDLEFSYDGNRLSAKIKIKMEGDILEYELERKPELFKNSTLKKLSSILSAEIEKEVLQTMTKLQKEFKTDAIGMERELRKYQYDIWKQVKDDWDQVFEDMNVSVDVTANIRRIGVSR